jgi:hypothetical protein
VKYHQIGTMMISNVYVFNVESANCESCIFFIVLRNEWIVLQRNISWISLVVNTNHFCRPWELWIFLCRWNIFNNRTTELTNWPLVIPILMRDIASQKTKTKFCRTPSDNDSQSGVESKTFCKTPLEFKL